MMQIAYWAARFREEELGFEQATDDLGDMPEAEASFYSVYGHLPGAMWWPLKKAEPTSPGPALGK